MLYSAAYRSLWVLQEGFGRMQAKGDQFDLNLIRDMQENKQTKLDVKMIVIDSITALFRSEFENNASDLKKRCNLFFRISACLKGIAKRFGVAVMVTNQVVDFMDDGRGGRVV
ncbi:DNA repair protein XRCC3 [Tanacetum coccineum]|uniref:DNA repair protein XRCC3 n=1 Tax=Tanacetum coccineum TaxID=301880 RepID=A0ABQ5AUS8_9ASTR